MEKERRKRGPRGKYARYICQRCRSRKIKCALPNPDNTGPIGSPLPEEKACERCRSLGLECIIEATVLGRPSHRRGPSPDYRQFGGYLATTTVDSRSEENAHSPALSDVREYFYTNTYENGDDGDDIPEQGGTVPTSRKSSNKRLEETFQSMVDPARFLSSVLARDQAFGSTIPHAISRFNLSLLDLISCDMAASLDTCLGWHRFFIPQLPTLVTTRKQLMSHGSASSTRSPTNLLFALLSLIALEMPTNPLSKDHTRPLVKNLKLAVSTYGQMFIFSTPIHPDSLTVSLLLADYKPTALISSQSVAHISINSEIYINIAYRVAERLNMLPAQGIRQLKETTNLHDLQNLLVQSSQAFQIYCVDASLDHFFIKPIETMQKILEPLRPQVELYQSILKSYQCLPNVIFHIQSAIAAFIKMDAITCIKQNWDDLDTLSMTIETTEKKALELVESNREFPQNWVPYENHDEFLAIQSLLELRSEWVALYVCGSGIMCAMASKARSEDIKTTNETPEPSYGDIAKTGSRVRDILKNRNRHNEQHGPFETFVSHFGRSYQKRLYLILEKLVSCMENLRLYGAKFQPPRPLILEAVMICRHIIENCLVDLQVHNSLKQDFNEILQLFSRFVHAIKGMAASSPWQSIDEAFSGGCFYAASNMVTHSLYKFMKSLKVNSDRMAETKTVSDRQPSGDMVTELPTDLNFIGLENWDPSMHLEGWDPWSYFSGYNVFNDFQQECFDWSSLYNLFPEAE